MSKAGPYMYLQFYDIANIKPFLCLFWKNIFDSKIGIVFGSGMDLEIPIAPGQPNVDK